ncbi:hypothetical protein M9Y10_041422 [Tritrichomonas musculus]|uniref:Rab-GAP TBC domain-containing protein n=1 Tax=Tritrichomonas musculus TaxID=1915356 RepID=A0ABR2K570_9EUKA
MFVARNDFLNFFPNCTGSSLFISPQLLKGASEKTHAHSALWKFYLLILPNTPRSFAKDEDWIRILKEKRDEFFELKDKYFLKPPDLMEETNDDPLLSSQSELWKQFHSDQELREQIRRDVCRAFQELDYFHQEETLQTLEDIIFLFCRTHPKYGYPQGLHEIAAFTLYVLHEEMTSDSNDTISFIFSQNAVIPDTYYVFSAIAELIEPFYRPSTPGDGNLNYLAEVCEKIQDKIIARKSPKLAESLRETGIPPHTYMMKWLRLLFLSVFEFQGLKTMWDIIFSFAPNLNICANICAAMLLNAEKKILMSDPTEVINLLYHYPIVPDPARFAILAAKNMPKTNSPQSKNRKTDLISAVSERLNELSHSLNEVCTKNGYELALPFVMDLCRTRDVLLGILPLDEMLPLEQAVELFKPQTVDYQVKQLPPESVITQNTKIVPPESNRPKNNSEDVSHQQNESPSEDKNNASNSHQDKSTNPSIKLSKKKQKKEAEQILFGDDFNDDLFSAKLKEPSNPQSQSIPPPQASQTPSQPQPVKTQSQAQAPAPAPAQPEQQQKGIFKQKQPLKKTQSLPPPPKKEKSKPKKNDFVDDDDVFILTSL